MSMSRSRGFTLIELLVVVAIVAILAIIALPSYASQVRHSRRSDAIASINSIVLAEEQWRSNCPAYSALASGTCGPNTLVPTFMAAPTNAYYTFTITTATASRYTIVATPSGDQTKDRQSGTSCNPMRYDFNAGVLTKSPAVCWGQ